MENAVTKAQIQPLDATDDVPNQENALWKLPGDRYRVVGEIARGGMGVVLRVLDTSFDRPLAIKILLRRRLADEDERRFLEEARITGQLQHPGIPPVHEMGRLADGRPFFSMKLIEGRTLADLLAERASPQTDLPRFLKIFEQIAQTLAYAHAQGVIHRDLKPSNIMVGAFGEVQVMDWGLARRLCGDVMDDGAATAAAADGCTLPPTAETEVRAEIHNSPQETLPTTPQGGSRTDSGRLTQAGQIMGTPAFMSPEQARGAIDALDERADLFGLGAILCVMLTGVPPYEGECGHSVFRRAAQADLAGAYQRLNSCGADTELIELCRDCLKEDASERPADVSVVAARVSAYLASIQEQLERARVEKASAEIRAGEERKRRRLAVGLATAVIVLVLGGGGVALWYWNDHVVRKTYLEREVTSALEEAERQQRELHDRLQDPRRAARLLNDPKDWQRLLESAQSAHKRALVLAAGGREMLSPEFNARLAALGEQLQADERDRQLAFALDRIRLETSSLDDGQVQLRPAVPKLARAFADAGFDIEQCCAADVAVRIRQSAIRHALVAGLDFWALALDDAKQRARLLEVARAADPDPWRDRFRQADVWQDKDKLKALATQVDFTQQSPQLLAAFGHCFNSAGGDAAGFYHRALVHHPRDFWLCFEFGLASRNHAEQAGAFRAALATRPEAAVASYNLGVIQQADRQLDEAVACYRKAAELDPKHRGANNNLGLVLNQQKKTAEAIACYRNAIKSDPDHPNYHLNLGAILHEQGDLDGAIACFRKALKLDSRNAPALNNLGAVLRQRNELEEAIDCFHKAIKINPDHAMAWCNLGHALRQQGKFQEALPVFQRGHKLGLREKDWSYPTALWVLETQLWIARDKKLAAVLRGDESPADAREQLALAEFCVTHKKRYAAAARFYAAAFAAEPKLADAFLINRRYNAACAAARAAAGHDKDAGDLPEAERQHWRKQALEWLGAELAAWAMWLEKNPASKDGLAKTLRHWQSDNDLASVRDQNLLAKLTSREQASWRRFWADVNALLERTKSKAASTTW
jgi:serine/threonine protein kinase/Tfp pilus assembly protein PilF